MTLGWSKQFWERIEVGFQSKNLDKHKTPVPMPVAEQNYFFLHISRTLKGTKWGQKTIFNVFSSCKQYYLLSLMINYFLPICSKEDKCRKWKCRETVPSECTSGSQRCKCIPPQLRAQLGKAAESSRQLPQNKTQQNRTKGPTIFCFITEHSWWATLWAPEH